MQTPGDKPAQRVSSGLESGAMGYSDPIRHLSHGTMVVLRRGDSSWHVQNITSPGPVFSVVRNVMVPLMFKKESAPMNTLCDPSPPSPCSLQVSGGTASQLLTGPPWQGQIASLLSVRCQAGPKLADVGKAAAHVGRKWVGAQDSASRHALGLPSQG